MSQRLIHLTEDEMKIIFAALTTYTSPRFTDAGIELPAKHIAEIKEDLRQRLIWALHQDEIDALSIQREEDRHDW